MSDMSKEGSFVRTPGKGGKRVAPKVPGAPETGDLTRSETELGPPRFGDSGGSSSQPGVEGMGNAPILDGLDRRYEMGRVLGQGGMGRVQVVFDKSLRREVAYKVVLSHKAKPATLSRFIHEGQVTSQLEHPNIVPIYEIGRTEAGDPYFTMKKVRGQTLKERLAAAREAVEQGVDPETVFPLHERLEVMRRVLDALGYAHDRRVIHCDLKPENIMVGRHGEVLVMDWGLARLLDAPPEESGSDPQDASVTLISSDRAESNSHRTAEGSVMGTPAYMSPEQARGELGALCAQSDLFAAGCVLYELLTLAPPYRAPTPLSTVQQALIVDYDPVLAKAKETLGRFAHNVPRDLAAITEKAMQAKVRKRYESAAQMRGDIDAWAQARPVSARKAGLFERAVRYSRRNPTLTLSTSVAAVFVLVLGLVLSQMYALQQSALLTEAELEASEAQRKASDAEAERAHYEKALAAERAEHEAARAEREAARAEEAEQVAEDVRDHLSLRAQNRINEFEQRRNKAIEAGIPSWEMGNHFEASEIERFYRAFEELFEVYELLGMEPKAEHHSARGWIRSEIGDDEGAIRDYDTAIELESDDPYYYNLRASAYRELGDYEASLADYNRALELSPETPYFLNGRASTKSRLGDHDAAFEDYSEAIRVDPEYSAAYRNRGSLRHRMGDYEGALEDLGEAIRINPNYAAAYWARGMIEAAEENLVAALEDFEEAIRINPSFASAYVARGDVLERMGEIDKAREDYNRAIDIDPQHALPYFLRGRINWAHADEYERAIEDLTRAIELSDDDYLMSAAHTGLAESKVRLGRFDAAIADYDEVLERASNPLIFERRAHARLQIGDVDGAKEDYESAVTMAPNNPRPLQRRARDRLYYFGEVEQALEDFERLLASRPSAYHLYNRAVAQRRLGRYSAALDDLSEVIRIDSSDAFAHRVRGRVHRTLGKEEEMNADVAEALRLFNERIEGGSKNTSNFNGRASVHLMRGDYEAAIRDTERAAELTVSNLSKSHSYTMRGSAYAGLGDDEAAMAAFAQALEVAPFDYDVFLERGKVHADRGRYAEAISDFTTTLIHAPGLFEARLRRAEAQLERNEVAAAIADLQHAYDQLEGDEAQRERIAEQLRELGANVDDE